MDAPHSAEVTPAVSVIVPVYKVERYLAECIESVLAQTFEDFEMILVDDGSPDNSGKICDDYAARDSRIRVFHKENGGVSSARNLGLDNARGEWIAFVDSDDSVGEKYLEHLWGGNADSAGPDAGTLVVSGHRDADEKGCILGKYTFSDARTTVVRGFCRGELYACGVPWAKLYFREIISNRKLRFDPEVSLCEDLLFMLHYLTYCRGIFFRTECDYLHQERSGSLSFTHPDFSHAWDFFIKMKQAAEALNLPETETRARAMIFRAWALKAVFTLYRPKTRLLCTARIEKLKFVAAFLKEDIDRAEILGFWEKLLRDKKFVIFDVIAFLLFSLRYGIAFPFWKIYRRYSHRKTNRFIDINKKA